MHEVDVTIIGAGVVGLAVAAQLAREERAVYILEKNETFGQETSGRNSGVIHSGIYYPADSLKARMCVAGNRMLYELCRTYGVGYQRLGKLIVAIEEDEKPDLEVLLERGRRNGAEDIRLLSRQEMKRLEPNVEAVVALFAPSTGIIDPSALMRHFLARAKDGSAQIAYRTKVVGIDKGAGGYKVAIEDGTGRFSFISRIVINCAGLYCDKVAELAGIDISRAGYKLYYCKGEYFSVRMSKSSLVSRLVYPLPPRKATGAGIHVTLDLDGRMRLGPSSEYVTSIDYAVNGQHKRMFYDSVRSFLPALEWDDVEPEMAGIRPTLQGPGMDTKDFVIRDEADKGLPGLINLIGIESPGLTASPAIAKYVSDLVSELLV